LVDCILEILFDLINFFLLLLQLSILF